MAHQGQLGRQGQPGLLDKIPLTVILAELVQHRYNLILRLFLNVLRFDR